ncbi:histidine phosphatase superfamily [Podospora appendiculata]|uniref:Histidine phosphatase superfamily n=1 Tax=Podospora appendiculata TaxID=314037 RepID=A0AAE0XGS1_9PEZI|nr:histidine phosphatase superfamily [Podospora appendiculata]
MTLEVIYVTRHGFRSNWLVDHTNGNYSAMLRSPTGIAADPALTAHGVEQARELGDRLLAADPPIERVYSSPYYRCLQTVEPFVRKRAASLLETTAGIATTSSTAVRLENGIGEWYGAAPFEHPVPASHDKLASLFPAMLDREYKAAVVPPRTGEGIDELHDRVSATMEALVAECDRDGVRAVLLCSHAAVIIALGRVLTGDMPDSIDVEDFRAFTCGLSVYRRRRRRRQRQGFVEGETAAAAAAAVSGGWDGGTAPATGAAAAAAAAAAKTWTNTTTSASIQAAETVDHHAEGWRRGRGVSGGWDCELNSDCAHLSSGEERGWRFSGDESFTDVAKKESMLDIDAGAHLGVVVEGRKTTRPSSKETGGGGSRL